MMEFRRNEELGRYEAWREGELVGEAHYLLADGVADFNHTLVPPQFEGQGIAGQLIRYAMDDTQAMGLKVRPTCPYVRAWLVRHPKYSDLWADQTN